MPSRRDSFKTSGGKEAKAMNLARSFLHRVLDERPATVRDRTENRFSGDLRIRDRYVEVKGQGIDPGRFPLNYVEVCEVFAEPVDAEMPANAARLCRMLGLTAEEMAAVPVRGRGTFGSPPYLHCSLESTFRAELTFYCNADAGWLYAYDRDEIAGLVRAEVRRGMWRGKGLAHDDSFGVQVPVAAQLWRCVNREWHWHGAGEYSDAVERLAARLR
jgi:hypothetical protein